MQPALKESDLPCRLHYIGNGVLRVQKPVPGAPGQHDPDGAHFSRTKLRGDRMVTEYVPGFNGLNFEAVAWSTFISGPDAVVEFTWPAWSCKDYERWRQGCGASFDETPDQASWMRDIVDAGTVFWRESPPPGMCYFENVLTLADRLVEGVGFLKATGPVTLFCSATLYNHVMRLPFSKFEGGSCWLLLPRPQGGDIEVGLRRQDAGISESGGVLVAPESNRGVKVVVIP